MKSTNGISSGLFLCEPENFQRPWIGELDFSILCNENGVIGIFNQQPVLFFTFPQRFLRLQAFADIAADVYGPIGSRHSCEEHPN